MVQIGFKCDKGIMRQNNEDACFVVPGRNVYVVADGVGGNNSGEVASRTAVSEIARMVNEAAIGPVSQIRKRYLDSSRISSKT